MLRDGKRNKVKHLIQYTESFGNECQNPFILENDKKLPDLPTYLRWDEFWDTFCDPSPHNIPRLVRKFRVKITRRPEINKVHPNQEEHTALKVASEQATCLIYPLYILNLDNIFRDPLYRGKQKDVKARGINPKKQTI